MVIITEYYNYITTEEYNNMIDIDKFIVLYNKQHSVIDIKILKAIRELINLLNKTESINNKIPYQAYILATVYWETDKKMYPTSEIRQVKTDTPRRKEVRRLQDRYWLTGFYGRGYCHLTWKENYLNMGKLLVKELPAYKSKQGDFLVKNPDLALDQTIAFDIMLLGMLTGAFNGSGHGLAYYLDKTPPSYVNARRTINGTDKAMEIALIAENFRDMLIKSKQEK